jgi:gliding motility-associated-like protein
MGTNPFGHHLLKACTGSEIKTGREGFYQDGYTYKWYNGATTHWFTFPGEGLYWVDITKDGCTGRDTIEVIYVPPPKVNLGNDTTLCTGNSLILDAGNPGASYIWNGNFDTSNQKQTFVVKDPGKHTVIVSVPGCSSRDTIEVSYKATSKFSLGPDQLICEGETVLLYPGYIDGQYLWQDGSTKPVFTVSDPGTYSVRMDEPCGTFYDTIVFKGTDCKLYMPNAFTPNNDGKNDLFKVAGYDNLSFFRLRIYNRGGTEVFISSLPEKGWDGLLSGLPQPQGVYVWMLEYKKKYSIETFFRKGTVTLIR